MKYLAAAFNFYIKNSIHVALAVLALSYITLLEFDLNADAGLLFFTFFGSIAGYNFIKNYSTLEKPLLKSVRISRTTVLFSLLCGIVAFYFATQLNQNSLLLLAVLFLLSFLYTVPVFGKTLRMYAAAKILVVALVWAGITVLLPFLENGLPIHYDAWFTFVQRILIVWVLTVPFEIRDMSTDAVSLGTLPQKFGVRAVKWQATLAAIAVLLLDQVKFEMRITEFVILVLVIIISLILVWKSSVRQSKYYAAFWVESVPILWLMMLLLAAYLLP